MMIAVPVSWHMGSDAAGGDIGVLEKIEGDKAVVVARLAVVEDRAKLLEMARPKQVVDVHERGLSERADRLALDHQNLPAHHGLDAHALRSDLAIGR